MFLFILIFLELEPLGPQKRLF